MKGVVDTEHDSNGVYEILDRNEDILYIGQGLVLTRVMSHFPDGTEPIDGARFYRVEYVDSKEKAEKRQKDELDSYYSKHEKYPPFNKQN